MNATPWPQVGPGFMKHLEEWSPTELSHALQEHPLLGLEALARLSERLPEASVVAERPDKDLVRAPEDDREAGDVGHKIRNLATSQAWFSLLNIEQIPEYARLVDQIVDAMAEQAGVPASDFSRRAAFIFCGSPGAVTAAHIDIEHNFCLQLSGERTLTIGVLDDPEVREREIRRYWNGSFGRLEQVPPEVLQVALAPGVGVYLPPYTPHWINNHGMPSLSLTVAFFTAANDLESRVQTFNERMRKLGMEPRPFGQSAGRDRVKAAVMRSYAAARSGVGRLTGRRS